MEFWNDIITTALLGTEKSTLAAAGGPAAFQAAMAEINAQVGLDKEERLLQVAALSFNVRQSGNKPLHQPALNFPQAAAESLPYCKARAAQVLTNILEEESQPLVDLWLERCIAARQLVLPELVPTLLNLAVQQKQLRQPVALVSGRRGEWLSRFNPAWEFSHTADEDQRWLTGNLDQRRAVLRRMRQRDAVKAREWLAQCWDQENANTRAELLKQLHDTVEPEDESFLLSCSSEKSLKVREEAIRLLQQLPGGLLVKKYIETAAAAVLLKKEKALLGLTTKTVLQIQPAGIPAKADQLPGIDYLSPNRTLTDEQYVLYQLIQRIPPAFWEQHLGLPPAAILEYFAGANEKYVVALAAAADQFKDAHWAKAYLTFRKEYNSSLLQLLPLPEREEWIIANFPKYREGVLKEVAEWPVEWSFELAKVIIRFTAVQPYLWGIYWYKTNIARIPVEIAPLLKTFAPAEPAHAQLWIKAADELTALLRLKEQTLKAFNE